jgi:protein-disulfide isomerase
MGFFGLILGGMVALGAAFRSESFERTNKTLSLLNILGVIGLLVYSVVYLGSLCLLCSGFYAFSLLSYLLFWRYGLERDGGFRRRWLSPSAKLLATAFVFATVGAWGVSEYHQTRREAQSGGAAARAVEQFYSLEPVPWPSFVSPYWTARSTERFDDAPIRIVEYADLLCSDCRYLHQQLQKLKEEFAGKLNIAFQFFPLEARCNDVVEKDLHPGACELSYVAASDPDLFPEIHDEIFENFRTAKESAEWRRELSRRHGVEAAVEDSVTQALVHRMIETGREYEKTSDEFSHGIRSTPTMIINNRMIIGTLPYEQLKAIFQALVDEAEGTDRRFMGNWEETS